VVLLRKYKYDRTQRKYKYDFGFSHAKSDFFENAGGDASAGMAGIKEEIEKRSSFQKYTFSNVYIYKYIYI
jgi:hypothetical protein